MRHLREYATVLPEGELLREYVREMLLTEVAKTPDDLPEGVYVTIKAAGRDIARGDAMHVYYSDESGERIRNWRHRAGYENDIHGGVYAAQEPGMEGECLNAWMVTGSSALRGWGPLLYDVMMEVVGEDGLMADRGALSSAAFNVWKTYMSRGDVQKKQLDDPGNTLTQNEKDNCDIDTALTHTDYRMSDLLRDDWGEADSEDFLRSSPVMKVYTKGPTTIQQLEAMGRLIRA